MHQHTTDLSARVHRWRATPHALPVIVRDHHAGGSTDPILPLTPQRSHKRFSGPLVAALACTALIYIASGIVLGLHAAGRI